MVLDCENFSRLGKTLFNILRYGFWSGVFYLWKLSDDWKKYTELCIHLDDSTGLFEEVSKKSDPLRWKYLLLLCYSVYSDGCHSNTLNPLNILIKALPVVGASSV